MAESMAFGLNLNAKNDLFNLEERQYTLWYNTNNVLSFQSNVFKGTMYFLLFFSKYILMYYITMYFSFYFINSTFDLMIIMDMFSAYSIAIFCWVKSCSNWRE